MKRVAEVVALKDKKQNVINYQITGLCSGGTLAVGGDADDRDKVSARRHTLGLSAQDKSTTTHINQRVETLVCSVATFTLCSRHASPAAAARSKHSPEFRSL